MKNLIFRTLTGIVFASAVIGSVLLGNIAFIVLFSFFTAVGTVEFFRMLSTNKMIKPVFLPAIIAIVVSFISFSFVFSGIIEPKFLVFPMILMFLLFIFELYRNHSEPIINISTSILPLLFIALPFSLSIILLNFPSAYEGIYLLAFFAILWTNDTMAYFTGITLGKNRLFERISPKKSWEGFFGGLIFSAFIGGVFGYFTQEQSILFWAGFAIIISLSATLGDLVESLFKRSSGVKDSGSILPGHGGVLDRFDGAFLALPFSAAYLLMFS